MRLPSREIVFISIVVLAGSAAGLTIGGGFEAPEFGIAPEELTEFQPNTIAKASEVNANFARVTVALNASEAYLESLVTILNDVLASQEQDIATLRGSALRRPAFRWVDDDSVVIDGASSRPMLLMLGGEMRQLSTSLEVQMTVVGPGGLDGGVAVPNRIYYLYAVPTDNNTVAGIASLNAPTSAGPFGHATWTYLGSFVTGNSAEILRFVFGDGQYRGWVGATGAEVTVTSSLSTAKGVLIPPYATAVFGRFALSGSVTDGDTISASPTEAGILTVLRAQAAGVVPVALLELPVLEPSTVYLAVSDTSTTGTFRPLGWTEDPLRFP